MRMPPTNLGFDPSAEIRGYRAYRPPQNKVRDANLASKFRIKIWTLSDQRGICVV